MRFTYSFTVWDYGEALSLHRNQKLSRRVNFALLYRIIPALAVVGLVLLGVYEPKVKTLGAWVGFSFVIAWLWIGIMLAFAPREHIRRGFKRSAPAGQATGSANGECVLGQVPGISESKWFWNGFVDVAQNDKLLLLYTKKDCFLILPTSVMTAEERMELIALIKRNLARK